MRTTIRSAGNKRPGGVLPAIYCHGVGRSGYAGTPSLGARILASGTTLRSTFGEDRFYVPRSVGRMEKILAIVAAGRMARALGTTLSSRFSELEGAGTPLTPVTEANILRMCRSRMND